MREHYLSSPQGRIAQYYSRWGRRLRLSLEIEPKSKNAMKLPEKLAVQSQILAKLQELRRRSFRGLLAAQIDLSATAPNPPHLYSAIKNLLDLFGRPLNKGSRRRGLVYYDDSQIGMLSVSYNVRAETSGIYATFSPLRDFIADISLAADVQAGGLPESEEIALEERALWPTGNDAIEDYFRLKRVGLPVDQVLFERLLLHQKRQAQEALLSRSCLNIRDLYNLYSEAGMLGRDSLLSHPAFASASAEANRWFRESPLRIRLPHPPQQKGDTKIFCASVDQALEEFSRRWQHICLPLLTPVALEVVFKPPLGSSEPTRDLDNLMKVVLARFHERLKPPANYVKALADGYPGGEDRTPDRLPPKSLSYSVVRMDVCHLARNAGDQSDGFLVMGVAADMIGAGGVWSRAEEVIDRWRELFDRRI